MKLIIDKGNTRTKVAIFEAEQMLFLRAIDSLSKDFICDLFSKYPITSAIYSSVSDNESQDLMNYISDKVQLLTMTEELKLPIEINYKPKHNLGKDRVAAIIGAYNTFPYNSVLIIDAGSCICYDYINEEGKYQGGSISLGFQMKTKALHTFTAKLPLVELTNEKIPVCSDNTNDCIKSGIQNGTLFEIQGTIDYYTNQSSQTLKILLTGGDADYISKNIKTETIIEENLVLKGLNIILDYNIKK